MDLDHHIDEDELKKCFDLFYERKLRHDTIEDQLNLVGEEAAELIIEINKSRRGLSSVSSVFEEACDVVLTIVTLLMMKGYDNQQFIDMLYYKMERTILEYHKQDTLKGETNHDEQ